MSDNKLGYNCRLALSMDDAKTSYQIGLAYSPETTIMYEKLPDPKIPIIRMPPSYKPGTIYARSEDLKTTYSKYFSKNYILKKIQKLFSNDCEICF